MSGVTADWSLDGRAFRPIIDVAGGEVDPRTVFRYREEGDAVWAHYSGGGIRMGYLVGTRAGPRLEFRYCQLTEDGQTSAGHCVSTLSLSASGAYQLHETWEWESKTGRGTSRLVEVAQPE